MSVAEFLQSTSSRPDVVKSSIAGAVMDSNQENIRRDWSEKKLAQSSTGSADEVNITVIAEGDSNDLRKRQRLAAGPESELDAGHQLSNSLEKTGNNLGSKVLQRRYTTNKHLQALKIGADNILSRGPLSDVTSLSCHVDQSNTASQAGSADAAQVSKDDQRKQYLKLKENFLNKKRPNEA
jgi:hypothetical protein